MRRFFSLLARGDVSDDGDAAGDLVLFVEQRRVMTFENTGLRRSVRMIFRNGFFSLERSRKASVAAGFAQKRKDVNTRLPSTSSRLRPEMRCIARFQAINLQSRSNANMPSTLASISRVSRVVESIPVQICVISLEKSV